MSLAEILISCAILACLVAVALGIFPFAQVANQKAWDYAAAHDLAQTELESMRAYTFDQVPTAISASRTVHGVTFTCVGSSAAYGSSNPVLLKKLSSVVTWTNRQSNTVELDTLMVKTSPPTP